jgi:hypothetical protein
VWSDTSTEYTLKLRNDTLELEVQPADIRDSRNSNDEKSVYVRENGAWYTVKIIYMEETINIYVNNILAVQIPRNDRLDSSEPYQRLANNTINPDTDANITSNTTINKFGLFAFNNVAEFGPLRVGNINTGADTNQKTVFFEHYYPLNMLALSKIKYGWGHVCPVQKGRHFEHWFSFIFPPGSGANSTFSYEDYLKFANDGGILIIMNIADSDFSGKPILFGKFFDIRIFIWSSTRPAKPRRTNRKRSKRIAGLDQAVDWNYADNRTAKSRAGGVTPIVRIDGDLRIDGNANITSSSFSIVPDNNNAYRGSLWFLYMNDDFYVQSVMYSIPITRAVLKVKILKKKTMETMILV